MRRILASVALAAAFAAPAQAAGPIPPKYRIMVDLNASESCREADLCVEYPWVCSLGTCQEFPTDWCATESMVTHAHECLPVGDGFPYDLVPWYLIDPHTPTTP